MSRYGFSNTISKAAVAGIVLPQVLFPRLALADTVDGYGHRMMEWSEWIIGPIMMLVGIAVLVGIVLLVVRIARNDSPRVANRDPAMEVLRERFARGEITEAEYNQTKRSLERQG